MSTKNLSELATREQAGHILDTVENQLLALSREVAQGIITSPSAMAAYKEGHQRLLDEAVECVQIDKNTITVKVKVKRGQTPQQLLEGTGRKHGYVDDDVVATMPLQDGEGEEEVEFVFFKVGRFLPDSKVEVERKKRGLVQDLAAQFQYNTDNPEFADDHPNGDSWKNANGKWCCACFDRWFGGRLVRVGFSGFDWNDYYWFGGRKVQPSVS